MTPRTTADLRAAIYDAWAQGQPLERPEQLAMVEFADRVLLALLPETDEPVYLVRESGLAAALCMAQEAGQDLDAVAFTTAEHWRTVAARALSFLAHLGDGS